MDRGAGVIGAWRALRDAEARHGVPADPAEVAERGGECSICQERFRDPTRLTARLLRGVRWGVVRAREDVSAVQGASKTAAVANHGDGGTVMRAHVF